MGRPGPRRSLRSWWACLASSISPKSTLNLFLPLAIGNFLSGRFICLPRAVGAGIVYAIDRHTLGGGFFKSLEARDLGTEHRGLGASQQLAQLRTVVLGRWRHLGEQDAIAVSADAAQGRDGQLERLDVEP